MVRHPMNDHTLRVLEFIKMREIVARFAVSEPGQSAVLELLPGSDRDRVSTALEETRELLAIFRMGRYPPLDGARDIRQSVERLAVPGMMLQPVDLLAIASTLGAGRRTRVFFSRIGDAGTTSMAAPLVSTRAARIPQLSPCEDAILAAIDENGEVRDSASPALRRVRKLIVRTRDEILERMSRILRDNEAQKVVQEPVITIRDDRYVLPLKPNFRQSMSGVVHGQSGSRSTLFVEPLEVLDQNNRLAELRMEEREEIERILREITSLLASDAAGIGATVDILAAIDAIAARARFGIEYNAAVPAIAPARGLLLKAAVHPLLVHKQKISAGQRPVVPNEIDCPEQSKALIISGPNAGGKTVVLKMMGLLCLMAQAGLPITAGEGSEVPVFRSVFADIGDEQSLEQDLSTYSSRVSRIAEILREAERDSLVLLDELGSGTDPAEGSALGAAVLESLLDRGCLAVVTTHHSMLKVFGAKTHGAVNAAMEFDPGTITPTYRFISGRPGRSYGLDLAERLGVPDTVVASARARLTESEAGLDRLLEQIELDARDLRQQREAAEQDRAFARRQRDEAAALLKTAGEDARSVKLRARQDASDVLASLRQRLKDLSRTAVPAVISVPAERAAIAGLAGRLEPDEPEPAETGGPGLPVNPGDRVRLLKFKKAGIVVSAHKDMLEVDADGIRLKLHVRDVVLTEKPRQATRTSAPGWHAELENPEAPSDRLNLIGLRVEEALGELERFLDRAGVNGPSVVTIIHGLGTGALKRAVTAYLKGHPLVSATRTGEPAEGGAGVTVTELRT